MAHCALCYSIVIVLTYLLSYLGTGWGSEKRILMTDQSYIQDQFDHLQSEIQELRVKADSQQTTINSLQNTVDQQQNTIAEQRKNITSQEAKLTSLEKIQRGTSFTRWGREDCPTNFSTLYSGFAGGSYYTHPGAAVDYQCLPPDPILGPHKDLYQGSHYVGYMYGAEYQETFGSNLVQDDVPCAVCYTTSHSMSVMIPARTSCYPGWTEAYHGDLATGQYEYAAASQYVCVDENPEPLYGNAHVNENGKLFYAVQAHCGSLRCPPYVNGTLLSCVVCVK